MLTIAILLLASAPHSGGTDASGCHRDRKTGTRHCHGKKGAALARRLAGASVYYPNCAAADGLLELAELTFLQGLFVLRHERLLRIH